jgi:membrane fusion protein
MEEDRSIFRQAASDGLRGKALGEIVLIQPVSFVVYTIAAAVLASAIVLFLIWGKYTERETLRGHLVPDRGIKHIYAPGPGTVLEKHVSEGQTVSRGDVLYILSNDLRGNVLSGARGQDSAYLDRTVALLAQQLEHLYSLELEQFASREGMPAEGSAAVEARLSEVRSFVAAPPLEPSGMGMTTILAPDDGIATDVFGDQGQFVDAGEPLLAIVPDQSIYQAHLYAPTGAAAFIREGDVVFLRYEAFPYQTFGLHRGTVTAITQTALPMADGSGLNPEAGGVLLHRVTVELDSQWVESDGQRLALRAGMLLEADVELDTRRIYEGILQPTHAQARQ